MTFKTLALTLRAYEVYFGFSSSLQSRTQFVIEQFSVFVVWFQFSLSVIQSTGAPNENIVQNHLNIALLNVF